MSYRGDDMDLRLPQGQSARSSRVPGSISELERPANSNGTRYRVKAHAGHGRDRAAPLWVDDAVLAVCNAAHEVAQALHSPEVLLQHMVHGVTRVPAAAAALKSYNIDREALRRDVTALISSTAARMPDSSDVPLTSSEFKTALRLAGDIAARRDAQAIAVEDLLDVLVNYDSDHPGVELLLSHMQSPRALMPAQAMPAQVPPLEAAYGDIYRQPERQTYDQNTNATEPLYATERYDYRPAYRAPLERLRERVPERLAERAPERVPGRVQERVIVREVAAQSNIEPALRALEDRLSAKLSTFETTYRASLKGFETERRSLSDLVQQLHADVSAHRAETGGLRDTIGDKIERISSAARNGVDSAAPILARLQGLESMFEGRLGDVAKRSSTLDERLQSIEQAFSHQTRETAEIKDSLSEDMGMLTGLLQKNPSVEGADFDELFGERLDTIETLLLDRSASNEEGLGDDVILHIDELLTKHHRQISESMHERERSWTSVNERLNKMEHILTSQAQHATDSASDRKRLIEAMNERMGQMETLVTQQVETSGTSFGAIEKLLHETKGPGTEHLVDIKGLLGRVNSAQQTTAEVFDQWRVDLSGDLSLLNSRMDQLEQSSSRPVAMLDTISNELRNLHVVTVEKMREPPKPVGLFESFGNWLFGPR